jgi:hypothetical protein
MKRIARVGATGAALTLASLPLLPMVAVAQEEPLPNRAQIEYQERVSAPLRLHYGTEVGQPTKAQVEYMERTNAATSSTSGSGSQVQSQSSTSDSGDAAVWQLAVSAAVGALITGGFVLTSRGVVRHRHALSS